MGADPGPRAALDWPFFACRRSGIVGDSAASSWVLGDRGPRMLTAQPDVTSAVDIFVKDLGLVLATGRAGSAALPLAAFGEEGRSWFALDPCAMRMHSGGVST